MRDILLEHKKNSTVGYFKKFSENTHTWEDFFLHINEMIRKEGEGLGNPYSEKLGGRVIGGVTFWQPLTMTIDRATSDHFKYLDEYKNILEQAHPFGYHGCFAAVSLVTGGGTTQHDDPVDVFYVQQVGSVTWEIEKDGNITEYVLEPGDAIFVPAFVVHEVKSLTPRAALSFMFYRNENNCF